MKTKRNPLILRNTTAAFAGLVFTMSSPLHAATHAWTGAVSGSWVPASGNWSPNPGFGTTADLTFNTVTNGNMFLAFGRTANSLAFGAAIDSDIGVSYNGNDAAGYVLTMSPDGLVNPSIAVDADATGNITLGLVTGVGTGSGSMALTGNLDVIHNGGGFLNFNRAITGVGFGITKTGTGTMVFNSVGASPNTFSGDLNINQGRLIANGFVVATDINNAANVNLGGGALEVRNVSGANKDYSLVDLNVTSASTLAYNNTNATNYTLTFSGANAFNLGANLTVQNISANTAAVNLVNITRNVSGAGAMIVEGFNNINSGTTNFLLGRVALGGTNATWTGALDIRKGTAEIYGTAANMDDYLGNIIIGDTGNSFGAGLLLSPTANSNITFTNDITVRSGGFRTIRSGIGPFSAGGDTFYTFNGDVALEGNLNLHTDTNNNDRRITIGGDISGVGGLSITKGNNGFVRLSGDNSYSGATTIGTGAQLNINSATGTAIGDNSAVTFAGAGANLIFNSTNETVGSIASSGTDGAINLGANTLTTGGLNTSTSYGGTISGTGGGLTKVGSGILTLSGNNTFTGTLALSGTGGVKIISDGSTRTYTGPITGTGGMTVETTNNITAAGDDFTTDRLRLAGNNSAWSGDLTISKGTVSLSGTNVNAAGTGPITIGNTSDSFGAGITFFPTGTTVTITYPNNIIVTGGAGSGFRAIKGSGFTDHRVTFGGTITLNGNLTVDHSWGQPDNRFTLDGVISGGGGLTITRSAGNLETTVVMTKVNDYAGPTVVKPTASLSISSTGSVTSNITVESTGRIGGAGGTSGNLTLASGANFFYFYTSAPVFDVGGTVTVDNSFAIASLKGGSRGEAFPWTTIPAGTYTLIATPTNTFSGIQNFGAGNAATGLGGGRSAYFQYAGGALQLVVNVAGYSSWATLNSAGANLGDDHDGDGVDNGTEYFIGGPSGTTTGFTVLPGVINTAGVLSVTWPKGAGYVGTYPTDFVVQTSDTLVGAWTDETVGVNVTNSATEVKYTFPAPLGTKKFARLKVTGPN